MTVATFTTRSAPSLSPPLKSDWSAISRSAWGERHHARGFHRDRHGFPHRKRHEFALFTCFSLLFALAPIAGRADGTQAGALVAFDIPAQALSQALNVYGQVTGMSVLVDHSLTAKRSSTAVKGILTPDEALHILITGTGLSVRYASDYAFTLEASASDAPAFQSVTQGEPDDVDENSYFASLQGTLTQILCRQPQTRPGTYRLGIQVWIGSDGTVRASHFLGSTGDQARDAAIAALLSAVPVTPPPVSLLQPVTILLLPLPAGAASECGPSSGSAG
jgi:hypothetical protein